MKAYWSENQHLDSRTNSFEQLALLQQNGRAEMGRPHFLPRTVRAVSSTAFWQSGLEQLISASLGKEIHLGVQFLLGLKSRNTAGNSRVCYLHKSLLPGERTATSNRHTVSPYSCFLKNFLQTNTP